MWRSALLLIVVVWLALVVGVVAQAHGAATAGSAPQVAETRTPPTKTPFGGPTDTPTLTATATPAITASPSVTVTITVTPTDTPTVYVNSGPAAPQPTKLVLSQPTVGSGGGGLGGGIAGLGDSSMFIAVVLGCVTSVLGIVIGGVALLALIRSGYGPFLRALFLGKRARPKAAPAGKTANGSASARGNRSARPGSARSADSQSRRVGDGTLNYQETGDVGALWRDADARQSGRLPRAPRDARDARDPRRAREDDYGDYQPQRWDDPRDSGRGRASRPAPRSDPRSRAGAARPQSRPVGRSRNGW